MNSNETDDDFDTEDFDLDDFDDDDGFGDLEGQSSLAEIWKNNPIVKIAVIGLGVVLLIAGVMFFSGGDDSVAPSRVASKSEVRELSGTNAVSPAMEEALQEENIRRIEDARRTGDSVIPMAIEPMQDLIPMQFEDQEEEDPLERWRQMQKQRLSAEPVDSVPQEEEVVVDTRTPAVNALSEAMAVQMEAILNSQRIPSIQTVRVSDKEYLLRLQRQDEERREAERLKLEEQLAQNQGLNADIAATVLVPAGTIEYAQMVTEANTDAPGPILAQVASGPLKGARLIGNFSSTNDYLTLNFTTVVLDGVSYGVSAVALDPNTTLPGVATDVNKRYLQRVALPAAAAFITGLTGAIAESGSTTVTIQGETVSEETQDLDSDQEVATGIAEAGEEFGEILDEMSDEIEPLIRVRAGTPLGILFLEPVFDEPLTANVAN